MVSNKRVYMWPEHCNFFRGITHEWMPYVLEMLFLFLLVAMSLLSSWDDMDVCVELLADDVWAAEDYKTIFLSVGVDIFDRIYLKERPISLPMVQISTIKRNYEKWG